jgi:tetratricopeptide (TPR) repeat protein
MRILLPTLLLLIISNPARAAVSAPCTPAETWRLPPERGSSRWFREFGDSLRGSRPAPLALSSAIGLRELSRIAKSAAFEGEFSEYWTARILWSLGLHEPAREILQSLMKQARDPDILQAASSCLKALEPALPEPLQQAIQQLKERNEPAAISLLERFLEPPGANGSANAAGFRDEARLLLGRAHYAVGRFREAAREFQRVGKTSNLEIEALENLSWAYLLGGRPDDAIGVGLQLARGPLRNTFAPEGMLVAAMAFHESCQYPEALRLIQNLRRDYAPVWEWLGDTRNHENGYRRTLAALKHQSEAPAKLQTEWIRNPEFLFRQTGINRLLGEPARLARLQLEVREELKQMIRGLSTRTGRFIEDHARLQKIRSRESRVQRYRELRQGFRDLRKMERTEKFLTRFKKRHEERIPIRTRALAAGVDAAFKIQQHRLRKQLAAVFRNSEWVEIEVLNGASRDLVWQESHPGFEAAKKELTRRKPGPDSAETWSWGRRSPRDWEESELWEDELGALKADAGRHCDLKARYQEWKSRSKE